MEAKWGMALRAGRCAAGSHRAALAPVGASPLRFVKQESRIDYLLDLVGRSLLYFYCHEKHAAC